MGDIVEQTKLVAAQLSAERFQGWVNPLVLNVMEAADEIERLRAENAAIRGKAIEEAAKVLDAKMYDFGCVAGEDAAELVELCAELAAAILKLKEKAE